MAARAALATGEGRFDEAEPVIFEALQRGQGARAADAVTAFGAQLYTLRWLQGRPGEVESLFRDAAEASPNVPVYRASLSLIYSELGRRDEARDALERLAGRSFSDIPQDFVWMITVMLLAEVCAALKDAPRVGHLRGLLLPYADLNMTVAHVVSCGAASRSLGLLATVLERWEEAERHFRDAIEMNTRMGFRPWVAMTQLNFAQMLMRRNAAPDRERAEALLREALAAAEEMGMAKVAADCRAL
jgi:tetratricopeptide (TPR) repeat protein